MTAADWLKAVVTVLSAGIAAWVAAQVALNRWRVEMIGRRRAELAEETLADFYRFRYDMIYFARHFVRAKTPEAREREWSRNAALVAEVEARRHRFTAVFGAAAAKPYDGLRAAKYKAFIDAERAIDEDDQFGPGLTAATLAEFDEAIAEMEAICRAAITAEKDRHRSWWQRSK